MVVFFVKESSNMNMMSPVVLQLLFYDMFLFLDINECDDTSSVCGASSTCTNTDGSYTCACVEGFEMVNGSCIGMFPVFNQFFSILYTYLFTAMFSTVKFNKKFNTLQCYLSM